MVCWTALSGIDIGGEKGESNSDDHTYFTIGQIEETDVFRIRGKPRGFFQLREGIIYNFTGCALVSLDCACNYLLCFI
jgi:hypothetical protein